MQDDLSSFIHKSRPYRLWLVIAFFLGFSFYIFPQIEPIIFPFLSAFIGAYALSMPMRKMEQAGVPRSVGALFLILLVFTFMGLFIICAVPFVKQELYLLIKAYPSIQKKLFEFVLPYTKSITHLTGDFSVQQLQSQFADSMGAILNWGVSFILSLLSSGLAIANILSLVVLTPMIMFYFLKDWTMILKKMNGLLPQFYAERIRSECRRIDETLGAYVYGQSIVCCILITCYMMSLWLIGLPYALFVGFFTGFLTFIPYLGVATGFLLALTLGLTHFNDFSQVLMIVIVYGIFSSFESYFLTPKLIGGRIGLHPVLIIFSLLASGSLFGLAGIIFALPLAAVIATLMRSFILWYSENFVQIKDNALKETITIKEIEAPVEENL
jgi:predicted PurR-regulated permease PerM